jgi:hypothetical protein
MRRRTSADKRSFGQPGSGCPFCFVCLFFAKGERTARVRFLIATDWHWWYNCIEKVGFAKNVCHDARHGVRKHRMGFAFIRLAGAARNMNLLQISCKQSARGLANAPENVLYLYCIELK